MQRSVDDVIRAWEQGEAIDTITLESEGSSQSDLHKLAFAMVKAATPVPVNVNGKAVVDDVHEQTLQEFRARIAVVVADAHGFTPREIISAESMAFLTMKHGWSRIISRHHELVKLRDDARAGLPADFGRRGR